MIKLSSALKQEDIKEAMHAYDKDGVEFKFVKKEGIALFFETNATDLEQTAAEVKKYIKAQPWGLILFFQVIPA